MASTPPGPLITTARLVLTPFTAADAPFVLELLTDPAWLRFIGDRGVRTVEEARGYLEAGPLASYTAHGFGLYRVALRDSGVPIGMCGLLQRDTLPNVDLGFACLPAHRRQGFMLEAARATVEYAHQTLGLTQIVAIVAPENVASIRMLETLGMRQEGTMESALGTPLFLYSMAV